VNFLIILINGFIAGLFSGFFGIGGAVILTPVIRIVFGEPARIALGTTVPTIIPAAVFGLIPKKRTGFLKYDVFLYSSLGSVIGSAAGAALTAVVDASYLMILTAILMLFLGIRLTVTRKDEFRRINTFFFKGRFVYACFFIGIAGGFFSGLLGIGGGLFLIPGYILLLGLNPHEAATTSLAVILVTSIPSLLIHGYLGHINWMMAGALSLSMPVGSYIGSKLNERVSSVLLRKLFGIFLIAVSIYFGLSELFK
jgi:hypothetical protein